METLKNYMEAIANRLNAASCDELYEEIQNAYDIKVTCTINGGYLWSKVAVALGGPNIYIDTGKGYLDGYWGGKEWGEPLNDSVIEFVDEYVEEIFNSYR